MQRLSIKAFQQSRWQRISHDGERPLQRPVAARAGPSFEGTAVAGDGGRLCQHACCGACRCEERAVMRLTSSGHARAGPAAHLIHCAIGGSA